MTLIFVTCVGILAAQRNLVDIVKCQRGGVSSKLAPRRATSSQSFKFLVDLSINHQPE